MDGMEVRQKKLDVFQLIIHSKNYEINVKSRCIDCRFVSKAAVNTHWDHRYIFFKMYRFSSLCEIFGTFFPYQFPPQNVY